MAPGRACEAHQAELQAAVATLVAELRQLEEQTAELREPPRVSVPWPGWPDAPPPGDGPRWWEG